MAKSLYIRPDEDGNWTGHCRLDPDHVGRVELTRSSDYDPTSDKPQTFGVLTWRQYKADGKTLFKQGHAVDIRMTPYQDGYKQLKTGIMTVGGFNHVFKLKYYGPRPEQALPACFTYQKQSTAKSTNVPADTMEV